MLTQIKFSPTKNYYSSIITRGAIIEINIGQVDMEEDIYPHWSFTIHNEMLCNNFHNA